MMTGVATTGAITEEQVPSVPANGACSDPAAAATQRAGGLRRGRSRRAGSRSGRGRQPQAAHLPGPVERPAAGQGRRRCGARTLEAACPMITQPGKKITWGEVQVWIGQALRGRRVRGGPPPHRPADGHADRLRTRGRRTLTETTEVSARRRLLVPVMAHASASARSALLLGPLGEKLGEGTAGALRLGTAATNRFPVCHQSAWSLPGLSTRMDAAGAAR